MKRTVSTRKRRSKSIERPFVTANFALTWDGRISTRNYSPSNFSSQRDKRRLVEIRAECDAVLVTAKTLASDNMLMGLPDAKQRRARKARGQSEYPVRVLISNSGRIDPLLRVFATDFSPIVVFSTERMPAPTRKALEGKAVVIMHDGSQVDLATMLRELSQDYGVKRIVCEGGGQLFRSLIEEALVDELHVTLCPRIFGGSKTPTLTGIAGAFLPHGVQLVLQSMEVIDDECFLRYGVGR